MAYRQFDIKCIGEFREATHGNWFTYVATTDPWAIRQGFVHEIHVGAMGEVRYGNVLKTVVHIAVDEAEGGGSIMETWKISKHNIFTQD